MKRYTIAIPNIDRCSMLRQSFEGQTVQDMRVQAMIRNIVQHCNKARVKTYAPVIDHLKTMKWSLKMRIKRDTSHLGRPLRGPASPGAFWSTFLFPHVQNAAQYQNEESAYNTVWDHEEKLNRAFKRLEDHHDRFKELQQGNGKTIEAIRLISEQLNQTVASHDQVFENLPLFMRASAEVVLDIQRDTDLAQDLITGLQQGQVDLNAVRKMHPVSKKPLDQIDPRLCQLHSFTYRPSTDKFELSFDAGIQDKSTTVYKAIVFKKWESPNYYSIYNGDKLLIHNEDMNCSKLVAEPIADAHLPVVAINNDCTIRDRTISLNDISLNGIYVTEKNKQQELTPTVIKIGDKRYIQCYQHEITIDNMRGECIQDPFSIPITSTIRIGNQTHTFELEETALNFTTNEHRQITEARASEAFLGAMEQANAFLKESQESNDKLKDMNKKGDKDGYTRIIEEHPLAAIGIGTTVLIILCLVLTIALYSSCRKSPIVEIAEAAMLTSLVGMAKSMPNISETARPVLSRAKSYISLPFYRGTDSTLPAEENLICLDDENYQGRLYPTLSAEVVPAGPPRRDAETVPIAPPRRVRIRSNGDQAPRPTCRGPMTKPPTPHPARKAPRVRYNGRQTRG